MKMDDLGVPLFLETPKSTYTTLYFVDNENNPIIKQSMLETEFSHIIP